MSNIYACLILITVCCCSAASHATIYTWVDEKGQVHFSDNKALALEKQAAEVTLDPQPNVIARPSTSVNEVSSQQTDKPITREQKLYNYVHEMYEHNKQLYEKRKAKREEERNMDRRCVLANKIISGELVLSNGLPTGKHELELARRDQGKYC